LPLKLLEAVFLTKTIPYLCRRFAMLIFPAIDILGGKAVRLFQGDYSKSRVFGDDPSAFAVAFARAGASHLHLVDLDGAREGAPRNLEAVRAVRAAAPGLFIELGGGIRGEADIELCFGAGVNRVIIGTSALRDPEFTRRALLSYGDAAAIGVDARDGRVAVSGWLETSDTDSIDFCRRMLDCGARHIIYTDISRDGASAGPNLEVYRRLSEIEGLCVTASGGISSPGDIAALGGLGLYAAIIGTAIYTGAVDLAAAVAAEREAP
jgi:phosphoribosylformimino-5-aminoimidazole carboxamide ribotide isomerase